MIINSINTVHNNNISSRGCAEYRRGVALYDYFTTSGFLRAKFNWRDYIFFLEKTYKDIPKVNIISHACSEAQETFSIKFLIMHYLGKHGLEKYHVEGRDFDAVNILYAKKGSYVVTPAEMQRLKSELGLDLYNYIDVCGESDDAIFIKVKDYIREQVPLKKVDILKDNDIPSENTSLLSRNMWPYMPERMQIQLGEKLFNQLSPSSHIVLGDFDISNKIPEMLEKIGFVHTDFPGIMKKPDVRNVTQEDAKTVLNRIRVLNNKI